MKRVIVYYILKVIFIIFYGCKIKNNKITFVSLTSDKLEKDFKLISNKLEKENNYEIKYILFKFNNTLYNNIQYLFSCIKQVYHINTSKVVILDYNNFVVSNFKKRDVKVVQLWHASGAVKKFGNDVKREYKIQNYDYVIVTSDEWKRPYSSAFNVNEENIISLGIPSMDRLFSKDILKKYSVEMKNKFPSIKGKKVILYAPTFRGDPLKSLRYEEVNLDYIKDKLGDDYVIIYKLHPNFGDKVISNNDGILDGNNIGIKKLFSITDYLITDYSSIVFEFMILNKPILFLATDLEQYKKDRGMYFDYENNMPGPICRNEKEVVFEILKDEFPMKEIEECKDKYFKYQDCNSTERTVDFIKKLI